MPSSVGELHNASKSENANVLPVIGYSELMPALEADTRRYSSVPVRDCTESQHFPTRNITIAGLSNEYAMNSYNTTNERSDEGGSETDGSMNSSIFTINIDEEMFDIHSSDESFFNDQNTSAVNKKGWFSGIHYYF